MRFNTRTFIIGLAICASLGGCVVEDKEPDTTVVNPPDNTTIIKETPDIVVNPPAGGNTTG